MYDPYNHISYVQLNKSRRGGRERAEQEKIYNRPPPTVKKIYVIRNGDSPPRPKPFVWRVWRSPQLGSLIKETGEALGFQDNVAEYIYDLRGRLIEDEDEITDGGTYIVAGGEPFDNRMIPPPTNDQRGRSQALRSKSEGPRKSSRRARSRYATSDTQRNPLTANSWPKLESSVNLPTTNRTTDPSMTRRGAAVIETCFNQRPLTVGGDMNRRRRYYDDGPKDDDDDEDDDSDYPDGSVPVDAYSVIEKGANKDWRNEFADLPPRPHEAVSDIFSYANELQNEREDNVIGSARSYIDRGRGDRMDNQPPVISSRPQRSQSASDKPWGQSAITDGFDKKRKESIRETGKEFRERKPKTRRIPKADIIYNRRDQTHPDAYIIYVFLNGQGMESQFMSFQRIQLNKGIKFILELIARRFGVQPAKLCNMDGRRIREVSDLMSRGAYVLIPAGQSFRETWYFLPDNAIDTSADGEKVLQRSEQRDRLIQRRSRHQAAILSQVPNGSYPALLTHRSTTRLRTMAQSVGATTSRTTKRRQRREDSRSEADQHYSLRTQSLPQPRSRSSEPQRFSDRYQEVRPGDHFSNFRRQ